MRAFKIVAIVIVVYVGIVAAFESLIGYFQPGNDSTLVITTQLYVAANHWPRAWYHRALENPEVQVTLKGEEGDYRAVPVADAEHDRVDAENGLPLAFRFLTGFPPRYFVRLDPR
jgi:hypothetical protein